MTNHPIDAVITWVDGSDPALMEKRKAFLPQTSIPGVDTTRFASCGEIRYCVLSILKYAPFFRNIFIVTDQQTPPILDEVWKSYPEQASKIRIVDHTEIFRGYEDCLPTFNSTSIISMIHRIENIAQHYVFFNDDMVLVRHVDKADFFQNGKPVQRGGWMGWTLPFIEQLKAAIYSIGQVPPEHRRLTSKGRMLKAARLIGSGNRTFVATHAPYAMRTSTLESFERQHPDMWRKNASYRFRSQDQFVAEAIASHLEFKNGTAIEKPRNELVYIREVRRNHAKILRKLRQADEDPEVKFMCIQNLDRAPNETLKAILTWLDHRILTNIDESAKK